MLAVLRWRAILAAVVLGRRKGKQRESLHVGTISHEAWAALTIKEQSLMLVVDDYDSGRFSHEEYIERLRAVRSLEP